MITPVAPRFELPAVEARSVRVRRGPECVISISELRLERGTTAVVGPNGSGKSTLLHLIAGMIKPDEGTLTVFGRPPTTSASKVAYVLQSQGTSPHLPVTAREVVSLGRAPNIGPFRRLTSDDRDKVDEAMERLEVLDLADRQMAGMSGGQRQRVLVAQGIAQDAPILLLDEPVAGVDIASIATIRRVVDAEREAGRVVVVATHDLGEASSYDSAVLMAGTVIAAGRPDQVLTIANLRAAYAGRLLDVGGVDVVLDDGSHHDHGDDHLDHDELGHDHSHDGDIRHDIVGGDGG